VRPGIEHYAGGILTAMRAAHAALSEGNPEAVRFWVAEANRQEVEVSVRLFLLGAGLGALPED
jgi:hypothetical protein